MTVSMALLACGWFVHAAQASEDLSFGAPAGQLSTEAQADGSVNPHYGTFRQAVALDLPRGVGGHSPNLGVVVDPGLANGLIESGWGLTGLGAVARRSANGGTPLETSTTDDLYLIDGQELYLQSTTYMDWFEPEQWDGSALFYDQESNLWERRKDGWVWHYGGQSVFGTVLIDNTAGNVLENTAEWLLTSVVDPFGNVVEVEYQQTPVVTAVAQFSDYQAMSGEHLPALVRYNGGSSVVAFSYSLRSSSDIRSPWVDYSSGREVIHQYRLSGIDSYVGPNHYSSYEITHPTLDEVQLERRDTTGVLANRVVLSAEYRAQGSEYWELDDGSVSGVDYTIEIPDPWGTVIHTADGGVEIAGRDVSESWLSAEAVNLNGDGFPDLVLYSNGCSPAGDSPATSTCGRPSAHVLVNVPKASSAPFEAGDVYIPGFSATDPVATDYSAKLNTGPAGQLVDLNGDGRPEVVTKYTVWEYRGSGFQSVLSWHDIFAVGVWPTRYSDIDGDGLLDLVVEDALSSTLVWHPNEGGFEFGAARVLSLPVATTGGCTSGTGHGVSATAPATLNVTSAWEYGTSQTKLSDVNGDGIADAVFALYGCVDTSNANYDAPVPGSEVSEIYWGDGRGGFVRSGLTAGLPFMEPTPFDTGTHAYDPNLWTFQDTFAMLDVDRSLVPEMAQVGEWHGHREVRLARFIDLAQGFNFEDLTGAPAGAIQSNAYGYEVYPRGYAADDPIGSWSGSPDLSDHSTFFRNTQALGSSSPYYRASVLADFDGDGFDDVIDFEPTFVDLGSGPKMKWRVLYSENKRTQPARQIKAIRGETGGQTELTWGYSATLGDNSELHYNRQVLSQTKRSGESPTSYRYFRGEHAAERFRGFGAVEVTNPGGATTEYGFGTAPHVEGFPSHVVAYRRDGTIEQASFNLFMRMDPTAWWWDTEAPYFNPISRQCNYALGHGTNSGGTRVQSVGVDDLWAMCVDSASLSKDEYTAGMGWHPHPDLSDPSSAIADEVWERSDDDDTSGTGGGGGGLGAVFPSGATDSVPGPGIGIELPSELEPPVASVGSPQGFGGVGFGGVYAPSHPAFPDGGSTTEVWETTTDYVYVSDVDTDGVDDHLLVEIEQYGVTASPAISWALGDDDTRVVRSYESTRDLAAWGFRLEGVSTRTGTGSILQHFVRADFKAFDVPAEVLDYGDDPFSPPRVTARDYTSGGLNGEVYGVQYPDGSAESWVRGSATGPCALSGAPVQHVDPVSRSKDVVLDGLCRDSTLSFEGLTKSTSYDGFNRVQTQTTAVENIDGTVSVAQVSYEYAPNEVVEYEREGSALMLRRRSEYYVDGYGREIASARCEAASTGTPCGSLPAGSAAVGSQKVYGSDGRVLANFGPYDLETPEALVEYSVWSGTGLLLRHLRSPNVEAPSGGYSALELTEFEYWPVSRIKIRPDGVVEESYRDAMEAWAWVGGIDRGSSGFDVLGRTAWTVDGHGKQRDFSYTRFGELKSVSSPGVAPCIVGGTSTSCADTTTYAYDAMGRQVSVDRPGPGWTEAIFDAAGRLKERIFHGTTGSTVLESRSYSNYAPGALPQVVAVNEHGASTTVWVDGAGREQQSQDVMGTSTTFFGEAVLPQKVQDVDSLVRSYAYDALDRLERVSRDSDGVVETEFGYGPFGVEYVLDADGVEVFQDFTVTGLPSRSYSGRSVANEFTLLSELDYDSLGWVEREVSNGVLLEYYYDDAGRVVETVVGGGLKRELQTWRGDDQLDSTSLSPVAGGAATTTFRYDAWGRLEGIPPACPS